VTRGPDAASSQSLDRSAALLQGAVADDASADAMHALGRFYLLQKEFDKAISRFDEALKKSPDDASVHSDLGAALLEKGKLERLNDPSGRSETTLARSLEELTRALQLNDSLLDARFNRALLYEEMKLTPQALADWEKYLSLDQSSPWADEARRKVEELRKRGERVNRRDDDLFNEFTPAWKEGNQEKVWQVFSRAQLRTGNSITNKLIDAYLAAVNSGRTDEAKEPLQMLTELAALSTDKSKDRFTSDLVQAYRSATPRQFEILMQARRDMTGAHDLYNQSKHDSAIELYKRAGDSFEQVGDRSEALLARYWISFCYSQRGDGPQESLAMLTDLVAQSKTHNYKWLQSIADIGLSNVHRRTTHLSQAVAHAWAAHAASQQIADENGLLRSLSMLAGLYHDLGNYRQALQLSRKGLDLGSQLSADASQMIGFYAISAWSFNALGHHAAALELEKQALHLGDEMNNPLVRSRYRVHLGSIQTSLKDYEGAIKSIRQGIEIGGGVGEEKIRLEMSAYGHLFLSRAYREAAQFDAALAALNEVFSFSQQHNEQLWLLHQANKERLLTRIAQGETAEAGEDLARVLDDYEKQREKIWEDRNRNNFFAKEQDIYDVAIDFAHSKLRDERQSFNYSERSRARSLFDTTAADWRVVNQENIPDLRFSSASIPMPLDELQRTLPVGVQILQFAVLKDKLIIWYLTNDRFHSRTVKVTSDELLRKVNQLLDLVSTPRHDNVLNVATGLYDLLIGPVIDLLDPRRQLCIAPDKVLNLLPFDILYSSTGKRYLIEDFALSYASSTNVFVHDTKLAQAKSKANERFLGVGNPIFDRNAFPEFDNLTSAATEVIEAGKFYQNAWLLTETEPTKTAVLEAMRHADVVHFATHYLPDATSPMLSKVLLATDPVKSADGVLHAYEIYRLKVLAPRLAILAGCRTGVENYLNGEGAIGLARPFKAAGVPVVIASLWAVDSQATTDLMISFHRLRTRERMSSAFALRAAQLEMLKHANPTYREPYYWASFSLSGGFSDY
jgi:CHAT domain-containing protein